MRSSSALTPFVRLRTPCFPRLANWWLHRLQIIDSTTITLFSNLIFKGVGRHPKTGKKKGGIKVHANIHANEVVPSNIRFTSAATNDSFMLMCYVNCYTFFEEPEKDSLLGPHSLQGPLPEMGGDFHYFCRFHVTFSCFPYYINGKVCIFAIEMYNCIGRTL